MKPVAPTTRHFITRNSSRDCYGSEIRFTFRVADYTGVERIMSEAINLPETFRVEWKGVEEHAFNPLWLGLPIQDDCDGCWDFLDDRVCAIKPTCAISFGQNWQN